MASKRISDIAKELGVASKVIIEKCLAEGVPSEKVKGHMSTVSAGLEASIREWFSSGGVATAIETTQHLDVGKVKAKAPLRSRKRKEDGKPGDGEPSDASHEIEPKSQPPVPDQTPTPPPVINSVPTPPAAAPTPAQTSAPAPSAGVIAPATPAAPQAIQPPVNAPKSGIASTPPASWRTPAEPPKPRMADRPPPQPAPTGPTRVAPPSGAGSTSGNTQAAPERSGAAARASGPLGPGRSAPGGGERPSSRPPGPHGPTAPGHAPGGPMKPVRMNVPERPKTVTPAGPQLVQKTAVKLSGPKVVRIEAPDVIDKPRARRDGEGGPRTGGEEDDASRSPRRNTAKRRTDTAAPGAGAAGGVPARRRGFAGDESMHSGMWRPQDLAEREARLSRASGYLKQRRQHAKKLGLNAGERAQSAAETGGVVTIAAPFTIKDLSAATGVKAADIIKKLFMQGIMATVNSGIDPAKAQEVMIDFDIELEVEEAKTAEESVQSEFAERESADIRPRGPIVTILGHVDHGKTSLLDKIRNANVAAGEAGGITQKTSAFRTSVKIAGEEKWVVFIDTPGHEAFTAMRARGAAITDVVVLVVSAPEGVMPQTIESINHAKAAKVPIVVALNKIDRPDATEAKINQTLGELAAAGLNPVEWGGDIEIVRTSATKGTGIEKLLEILDLQGQLLELKAGYSGPARGAVVDARLEEGRGPVADVVVQDGELKVGDFVVVGPGFGRVREIVDDRAARHKSLGPTTVARISGFDQVPDAGDKFYIVDSLKKAQEAAEQRRARVRQAELAKPKVTLDSLLTQMKDTELKEILVVLKADVQGSVDVLKSEIERVKHEEVRARVLHSAVGGITESDVLLADASKAIIIGFNVIPSGKARNLAEQKGVEIRSYQVIYEITDDIKKAAEGLLSPEQKTQILGHAEVRKVFKITKVGSVAGCFVTDGTIERDALIRVTRNGIVVENNRKLEQLKRVKDDAKEVRAGLECGMKIVGYDDIKEGDVLECYKTVEVKRTL
ncbi:MAG: translation initiation factor IF-2 [Phycisphaerales bacterium]|nr:translation initiation factor IF-2 [Phycisphaerales bacterium]